MPKFRIQWDEVHHHDIDVEADGEAEAREQFWLRIHVADPTLWDDTEGWISEPQDVRVTEWHTTYQGRQGCASQLFLDQTVLVCQMPGGHDGDHRKIEGVVIGGWTDAEAAASFHHQGRPT